MEQAGISIPGEQKDAEAPKAGSPAKLRLYIARSTPNSVRAQHNLLAAIERLEASHIHPAVEIIDVFSQAKRAVTDGVVVTPTLIAFTSDRRIVLVGDLSDKAQLHGVLQDLLASRTCQ